VRTFALAVVLLPWSAAAVFAQERWRGPYDEIRPFAGAFVPLGAERADFRSATMVGVQLAADLTRHFHGVVSLSWTHGHNRMFTKDLTHIWQYDGGLEFNAVRDMGRGWYLHPFVGAGIGGRTYDYADHLAKNTSCIAAYGSVGAEIQRKVITLRAEARDYLSCYESPISTERRSRNDLGLTVGVAFHRR